MKKLTASDGAASDYFGFSAALSGDTLVVGALSTDGGGNSSQSAAYVFSRNQGGDDNWGEVQKLTASDGAFLDHFGYSVAVSGDTLVVGANAADVGGHDDQGAAYVYQAPLPSLSISKVASPDPVQAGGLLTYTLTITNSGSVTATNVVITDALPANTTFVSASDGGTETNGVVEWSASDLADGDSINRTLVVAVSSAAGDQVITNETYGARCDEVPAPVWGAAVQTTVPLALAISKFDDPDPVAPGGVLSYTIVVAAASGTATKGLADGWTGSGDTIPTIPTIPTILVTDTVPANTTCCASIGQGGTLVGNKVTWSGLEISPTQGVTLTFAVTVDTNAPNGMIITNDDYGVAFTSTTGMTVTMGSAVTTTVEKEGIYLPFIRK